MEDVHVQLPAASPATYLRCVGWWRAMVARFESDSSLLGRAREIGAPLDVPAVRALSDRHAEELEAQARGAMEKGLDVVQPTLSGEPMTWRLAVAYAERRRRLLAQLEAEGRAVARGDEGVLELRRRALAAIVEEVEQGPQLLRIEPEDEPGSVRLVGEIDATTVGAVTRALESELEAGYRLSLDLSQLAFVDSTGIRMLLTLAKRARSLGLGPIFLRSLSPAAHRILQVIAPGGIPGIEVVDEEGS